MRTRSLVDFQVSCKHNLAGTDWPDSILKGAPRNDLLRAERRCLFVDTNTIADPKPTDTNMRFIYTAIFYAVLPLILLRLLWRARKSPAYKERWDERFGKVALPYVGNGHLIWLHSVSVGETIAAAPLVHGLLARYPASKLLLTTTTPTGSERVQALFAKPIASGRLYHCYAPYDLPHCLNRFLAKIQPALLIVMETELWPNTIAACARRDIPVVLVNGRLSEKSARSYGRFARLTEPMLKRLSLVAAQHEDDGDRFLQLGLPRERLRVTGNIKFDLTIADELRNQAQLLRMRIEKHRKRVVWIAASTHRGEDEFVLEAFKEARRVASNLFLILVPRHPERFDEVANLCAGQNLSVQRRSGKHIIAEQTDVLLGDTMGELLLLYGVADFAFVGGSLVPVGGHNLMEPAAWALPIISGEHLFNFSEASRLLLAAGGMLAVQTRAQLASAVCNLVQDQELREMMGERSRAVAEANRGALEKLLGLLEPYCSNSSREI